MATKVTPGKTVYVIARKAGRAVSKFDLYVKAWSDEEMGGQVMRIEQLMILESFVVTRNTDETVAALRARAIEAAHALAKTYSADVNTVRS